MIRVLLCALVLTASSGCGAVEERPAAPPAAAPIAHVGAETITHGDVESLLAEAERSYEARRLAERALVGRERFERELDEAGVSLARMRATVEASLRRNETFRRVVADVPRHSGDVAVARRERMEESEGATKARLAAITRYEPGYDPKQLRRPVPPERPPQPQRSNCALVDGFYSYDELVRRGCAGEFPVPCIDGPRARQTWSRCRSRTTSRGRGGPARPRRSRHGTSGSRLPRAGG
jgi:hypothetical protein